MISKHDQCAQYAHSGQGRAKQRRAPRADRYVPEKIKSMFHKLLIVFLFSLPVMVHAVEYHCIVEKKFDSEREYTPSQIAKGQYSIQIEENGDGTFVSRCSYTPSAQKLTCDRYQMDKVVRDNYVKIKKYYLFSSQFDVQLYPSYFL